MKDDNNNNNNNNDDNDDVYNGIYNDNEPIYQTKYPMFNVFTIKFTRSSSAQMQ